MSMPHHFASLVEGRAQRVHIVGIGVSAHIAPTVGTVKGKLDLVAVNLGIGPNDIFMIWPRRYSIINGIH